MRRCYRTTHSLCRAFHIGKKDTSKRWVLVVPALILSHAGGKAMELRAWTSSLGIPAAEGNIELTLAQQLRFHCQEYTTGRKHLQLHRPGVLTHVANPYTPQRAN
jgi:hypothetical protein